MPLLPLRRLFCCLLLCLALPAAATPPVPVSEPAPGVFLVAGLDMADPRFRKTVILLAEHGPEGSLGLVLNRPTPLVLGELVPELAGKDSPVFLGGPVALNLLLVLFRAGDPPEPAENLLGDVYFSGDRQVLETLLEQSPSPERLRIYLGYAGWGAGQLEQELLSGGWHLFRAEPERAFDPDPAGLWDVFMGRLRPGWRVVRRDRVQGPTWPACQLSLQ